MGLMTLGLLGIAYLILERGCRDRPASKQPNWFELMNSGALKPSKKARTRGR